MMRRRMLLVSLAAAALAAGCLETEQDFTLNPDGTGKVTYMVVTIPSKIGAAARPEPPAAAVKRSVVEVLRESRGVEVWRDVQYAKLQDGRVWFKGTAYFRSLSGLKLHLMKASMARWREDRRRGGMALEVPLRGPDSPIRRSPPKLSDAQVAEAVKDQRAKYEQAKELLGDVMQDLQIRLIFRLPSKVVETQNLKEHPDGSLRLTFTGARMLQGRDRLVASDSFMEHAVRSGIDMVETGPGVDRTLDEEVYGLKGPIVARVRGEMGPLFDYGAEVAKARREYPDMIDRLGLKELDPPPLGPR